MQLKKPSKNLKRQLAKAPPKRKEVGGGGRDVGKEAGVKRKKIVEGSKRRYEAKSEGIARAGHKTDVHARNNARVNIDLEE